MIRFGSEEGEMLRHIAEVIEERMDCEGGYEVGDYVTNGSIRDMGHARTGLLVLDGAPLDADPGEYLAEVVRAELRNWVPDASQRLIARAARALGFDRPDPQQPDCGPGFRDHDWGPHQVAGIILPKCTMCDRLTEKGH